MIQKATGEKEAAKTWSATKKDFSKVPDHWRIVSLADEVAQFFVVGGCHKVTIETPVYKRNPKTLGLQWQLVGALTYALMASNIEVIYVGPSQAKAQHTGKGNASKLDMILHGTFDGPGWGDDADQEALADAEAMCNYGRYKKSGGSTEPPPTGVYCKEHWSGTSPDV